MLLVFFHLQLATTNDRVLWVVVRALLDGFQHVLGGCLLAQMSPPTLCLYDIIWVLFGHCLSEISDKHEKCLIVRIKVSSNLTTYST